MHYINRLWAGATEEEKKTIKLLETFGGGVVRELKLRHIRTCFVSRQSCVVD